MPLPTPQLSVTDLFADEVCRERKKLENIICYTSVGFGNNSRKTILDPWVSFWSLWVSWVLSAFTPIAISFVDHCPPLRTRQDLYNYDQAICCFEHWATTRGDNHNTLKIGSKSYPLMLALGVNINRIQGNSPSIDYRKLQFLIHLIRLTFIT